MIRKAGNRAFRALADILDLPGTEHLGAIDIGVVSPVLDVATLMQANLVERWTLEFDLTQVGPGTEILKLLPLRTSGLGDSRVSRAWRNGGEVPGVNPMTAPFFTAFDGKDLLIEQLGVLDGSSDLTAAQVYLATAPAAVPRLLLAKFDGSISGMMFNTDGPATLNPLPWPYYAGDALDQLLLIRYTLTAGGSPVTSCTLRLLACEPGVLSYAR